MNDSIRAGASGQSSAGDAGRRWPAEPGTPPDRPAGELDGLPVPGDGSGGPPRPEAALDEEDPDGETWVPV